MHILEFLNKYEYNRKYGTQFNTDWESVKSNNLSHLNFLMEQIIEKNFPAKIIKNLFNSAPNEQKEELKNNSELFKWSVAFHSKEIITFFYKNLNIKDEQSAVNAAIVNFRLDNLKVLHHLGINVFTDKNFCQAINRSYQPRNSSIIEYYLENKDKFEMSNFSKNLLFKHKELLKWMITDQKLEKISFLIQQGSNFDRGELFKISCQKGQLECLKYLLDSDDFKLRKDVSQLTEKIISEGFVYSVMNDHMDIVEYLIFEKNIKKNKYITSKIIDRKEIFSLFLARELNYELLEKKSHLSNSNRNKV